MQFRQADALLIVDVQRDFCAGGALAVAGGDEIVPAINRLIERAVSAQAIVVATRDWHPEDHVSFHQRGGPWPRHCVEGSEGAEFHAGLRLPPKPCLISKGSDRDRDQYSAFDATGLARLLSQHGARRVIICGLALDICVRATALDAVRLGFETHLVRGATRPVSQAAGEAAIRELVRAGVIIERNAAP